MKRYSPFLGILQAMLLTHSAFAAELPVREVVLFKHGVGYFQRAGDIKAGEPAQLDFKAEEMNDVLKSLTVEERGGGKITGLRYDSSDTLENKLQKFPFAIGEHQSLAAFFDHLKGARVEIRTGGDTAIGAVLGGRTISNASPERDMLTLLTDSGDIRMVDLASASSIRFADAAQQALLKDYLSLLNQSRSRDKRSVYIDSTASGARQLSASYMIPTAVWKSSYRLIFGAAEQPTLEGWAIVDNTTGEDWNNVRLAVVSGRPISFVSKLYEPKYRTRPVAELAEDAYVTPMLFEGAMSKSVAGPMAAAPAPSPVLAGQMFRRAEARQMPASADMAVSESRIDMMSNIAASAEGRDLADLFEYRFGNPVTVKKNESAMLPFLQQKVGARRLLIYSTSMGVNPMSAAEIINATGKTLDGGPITVYDSNAYSGEALVESIKNGDKRLISYAVDLGTRITTAFDSSRDLVREMHVRRGILTTKNAMQETKTFTIRNVDAKAKSLIIEHPQRPGYVLLNMKATETTVNALRFEVKLAANSSEKFAITEERVYDTTISLSSLTPDVLGTYLQNKSLSPEGKQQLEAIAAKKREIAVNNGAIARTEAQINTITNDQSRLRSNIESLNRVSGQQDQVQRYARQLATLEASIATARDGLSELQKKKATLESELNGMIEKASF